MILKTKRQKLNRILLFLLAVMSALFMSACRGLELENKTEQVEEYTKPQVMILIANERNRYENIYTDAIWQIRVGDEETGFDALSIQNVKQYMERLKLLNMLAGERGITVTSTEKDQIRQLTDAYMNGLTDADLAYMGCDRSDVQKLYTDLFTAHKLVNSITETVDSDISDSEAKVIRIQQIGTTDLKKAKAILKRIKIDGVNFNSLASRYTEAETIERTILKNSGEDLLERTAFALEEGQVSNILAIGEMYYIIKCTDGYAEAETLERKNRLENAMNNKAVRRIVEPYAKEHNIQFVERFWNEIDFSNETGSTVENFFDLYEKAFDQ